MKYLLFVCSLISCFSSLFSQHEPALFENFSTTYERTVLLNKESTNLDLLMAMGSGASEARTLEVKRDLDAFINEIESSGMMRLPEVKLMKELHRKVHDRFLTQYQYVVPFHEIFASGKYNCVSATALFALVLEALHIPYNIQEQPAHVYIMAYPDTKAISVEMTALKNASYLPTRKDVSRSIRSLYESGLISQADIANKSEQQIYQSFYNTNSVINLVELAGIQYFNEAIGLVNENHFEEALSSIYKAGRMYDVEKTRLFKTELLGTLISEAKFDRIKDINYLIGYANLKKKDHEKVYYQYASFIHDQLITKSKRELIDSSFRCVTNNLSDTILKAKMSSLYYLGLSEYFSNAYNLKKQLENAEMAYTYSPDNSDVQLWLVKSIVQSIVDKYEGEDLVLKMDEFANRYAFLKSHNLFLRAFFLVYTDVSNHYYTENDGVKGKKYFDLALQVRETMPDKEVLEEEQIGWLYAEAGAYLYRENDYKAALEILEAGLKLAPGHERLLARIEIVKSKLK